RERLEEPGHPRFRAHPPEGILDLRQPVEDERNPHRDAQGEQPRRRLGTDQIGMQAAAPHECSLREVGDRPDKTLWRQFAYRSAVVLAPRIAYSCGAALLPLPEPSMHPTPTLLLALVASALALTPIRSPA